MTTVKDVVELLERMKAQNVSDEHITALQEAWEEDEYDIGDLLEDMGYGQDESTAFSCLEYGELEKRLFAIAWAILQNESVATEANDDKTTTTATSDNNNTAQTPDVSTSTATPSQSQAQSQADEKNNDDNNLLKKQKSRQEQIDDLKTPLFLQHLLKIDRYGLVAQLNGGYCKEYEMQRSGTVILNAGAILIPDDVIVNGTLLETIWGVTYVLEYNNIMLRPPRLQYSFVEFWREYLQKEKPKYEKIAKDIQNNNGGLYEYLIEYPHNDRILPVLEKIIDQLGHPKLRANAKKEDLDMEHVDDFFLQQCSHWYDTMQKSPASPWQQVQTTCALFKKNTHSQNFNTFELFNTIMDVYDRILYAPADPQLGNATRPADITGTPAEPGNIGEHDFAAELLKPPTPNPTPYCEYMNTTLTVMKDKQSFFPRLQRPSLQPGQILIQDSCREFQKIALAFLMFIKAFMCESGNELETDNHERKPTYRWDPKTKQRVKTLPVRRDPKTKQRVRILPLGMEVKTQDLESRMQANKQKKIYKYKSPEERTKLVQGDPSAQPSIPPKRVALDDSDVAFHNGNFPLQIDLVVIPKDDTRNFGFDTKEAYSDEFAIATDARAMPDVPASAKNGAEAEKRFVCAMYGRMVSVFRDVITKEKNQRSHKDDDERAYAEAVADAREAAERQAAAEAEAVSAAAAVAEAAKEKKDNKDDKDKTSDDTEKTQPPKTTARARARARRPTPAPKRRTEPEKRRDDRYVMVVDRRRNNAIYMYPPHIFQHENGSQPQDLKILHQQPQDLNASQPSRPQDPLKILHRERVPEPRAKERATSKQQRQNQKTTAQDKEEEKLKSTVDNRYSYIADKYNELTNFYLTHKCLIPKQNNANEHYGAADFPFVLSAHYHVQREWHKHPKLRIYQYFHGNGMRFFYKLPPTDEEKHYVDDKDDEFKHTYDFARDLTEVWPQYFLDKNSVLDRDDSNKEFNVAACKLFDAVFDLYKCDAQFFQWDNAVKRRLLQQQQQHGNIVVERSRR